MLNKDQIIERDECLEDLRVTTYKERKGYIFLSYKSDDWERVFKDKVFKLQENNLRIYCDKDFDNENHPWLESMEKNVKYSSGMMVFFSKNYVCSYATLIELLFAIQKDKPIIPVFLDSKEEIKKQIKKIEIDLEDESVKMTDLEWDYLKSVIEPAKNGFGPCVQRIKTKFQAKISHNSLSTIHIYEAFEIIFESGLLQDNAFEKPIYSLIETVKSAVASRTNLENPFDENHSSNQDDKAVVANEQQKETIVTESEPLVNIEKQSKARPSDEILNILRNSCEGTFLEGKSWVKDGKTVNIRCSDTITINTGYDYFLYSFDQKITNVKAKGYYILKAGKGKGDYYDATNLSTHILLSKTAVSEKDLTGFKKITLDDIINGKVDFLQEIDEISSVPESNESDNLGNVIKTKRETADFDRNAISKYFESKITLDMVRKIFNNKENVSLFRAYRENMPYGGKSAMDYAMASVLSGCNNVSVTSPNYQIFYYSNAIADPKKAKENGKLGATWTWSSNCRKVLGINGSGQIPDEYNASFSVLPESTTLGELMHNFDEQVSNEYKINKTDMILIAFTYLIDFIEENCR